MYYNGRGRWFSIIGNRANSLLHSWDPSLPVLDAGRRDSDRTERRRGRKGNGKGIGLSVCRGLLKTTSALGWKQLVVAAGCMRSATTIRGGAGAGGRKINMSARARFLSEVHVFAGGGTLLTLPASLWTAPQQTARQRDHKNVPAWSGQWTKGGENRSGNCRILYVVLWRAGIRGWAFQTVVTPPLSEGIAYLRK